MQPVRFPCFFLDLAPIVIFLYLSLLIFLDSLQINVFYESHAMNFNKGSGKNEKNFKLLGGCNGIII